jgi:hypothetical protein
MLGFVAAFAFLGKRDRPRFAGVFDGGIAQLGERLHGMQEVSGSIPLTSTGQLEPGFARPASRVAVPFV